MKFVHHDSCNSICVNHPRAVLAKAAHGTDLDASGCDILLLRRQPDNSRISRTWLTAKSKPGAGKQTQQFDIADEQGEPFPAE